MKQRVKRNNRKKAIFGIDDLILGGIIAAVGAVASAGISSASAAHRQREQNRLALLNSNNENAAIAQTNEQQAINYDQNNELETMKTSKLSTIDSQSGGFKCGGKRRMKRAGGNVTSNISKLGLYI